MRLSMRTTRTAVQVVFLGFVVWKAVAHQLNQGFAASLDALCPFGAVETAGRLAVAGRYLQKLNASNVILGIGLLASLALVGGVFCGWICPLGALQEWLTALRGRLRIRELGVGGRVARYGSLLKYVVLAGVLWATYSSARLIFADYDPYRTIFSLHWLFSPSEVKLSAWLVTGTVLVLSFLIPKFWCRFLCPLGALASLANRISLFRLKRTPACSGCGLCSRACPSRLDVASGKTAESCGMCLNCVGACPKEALVIEGSIRRGAEKREVAADAGR